MASFEWIIILLVNILITIDSFVIESNHNIYTTQASDSPSIQNPIEGFGDFHYPLDPEDVERRQLEEERHDSDQRLHSINKDLKNTNQNKSQDNSSYYFSGSDRNYNKISESLDNSSETKFHIGFAGDVHYEEVEGCYCRDDRSHHRTEIFGLEVVCRCSGESVTQIPTNLTQELTRLSMISLGLEVLHSDAFHKYENLTDLYMESMKKLRLIESGVFLNLAHLRTVYIKFAPLLTHIPEGVFLGTFAKLRILRIVQTGLETMPVLNYFNTNGIISMIDFDSNRIRNLTSHSITVKAEIMNIDYNMIECVQNWAFHGSEIAKLSLKGNKNLVHLQEKAFEGLKYLRELDLSETSINKLPTLGFDTLEILKLQNTFTLKEIPSVMNFKNIRTAYLTYPYHCCAFKFPATHNPKEFARYQEMFKKDMEKRYCIQTSTSEPTIERSLKEKEFFTSIYYKSKDSASKLANRFLNLFSNSDQTEDNSYINPNYFKRHLNEFGQVLSSGTRSPHETDTVYGRVVYKPEDINQTESLNSVLVLKEMGLQQDGPTYATKSTKTPFIIPTLGFASFDNFENEKSDIPSNEDHTKKQPFEGQFGSPYTSIGPIQRFCGDIAQNYPNVKCYPIPDAFNPCEDIMSNAFLRILVWIVVIAAVLGNSAVMIVLMSGRFTFNVSKFLMINLAIADLMMGVYLLIIAIVDLRTVGVYFNYAIDWQHGPGCKIAGFITVFASELSIFTLTVITLERWFAITFAIQLNKRLKLGLAVKVMMGGWIYALLMASLPLMGISAYSKTSICLPMENKEVGDVAYLISLLTINGLAFVLISACYAKMYCSIISQQTRATVNDMTIAKRMALLVFTDFICWAPIAFFGLTAIAGFPLIDVPKSKFLLVTFYPLNSCANPFLYAILTKQYRRDFFILASRYGFCTKRAMKYKNASSHGHLRVAAIRSNNAAISGSIFSQVSCDGHVKHHYKYICRGHGHHHGYQDDNSCRSAVFSTVDIYPEFSSRSNSRSNDSTHEIVKIGHKNGLNREMHQKKNKKDKHRKFSMDVMSSEDESTSSALHKGSPHPIRNSHTKLNRLPSGEQQQILKRALQMDKTKCCLTCAQTNSCRRKCSTCIQRDSSSGEKSVVDYDSELLRWTKTSRSSKCPVENQSFVMSSHSNSAAEDTEI